MSSIVKLFDKHWISTVFCNTWLVWAVPAGAVPLYVIRLDTGESDPQGLFCTVQCCIPPLCLPWSVMEGWDLSASSSSPMGYPGLWATCRLSSLGRNACSRGPECLPHPKGWWAGAAGVAPSLSDCFQVESSKSGLSGQCPGLLLVEVD